MDCIAEGAPRQARGGQAQPEIPSVEGYYAFWGMFVTRKWKNLPYLPRNDATPEAVRASPVLPGLTHAEMDEVSGRADAEEDKHGQAADEEGDGPAGLVGGLGDAERVDEGVGEEIEEAHAIIMRRAA